MYPFGDTMPIIDNLDNRHGYVVMISSVIFFIFCNLFIIYRVTPVSLKTEVERWKWRNLLVSWVHALIAGVWVITSLLILHRDVFEDLMLRTYYSEYLMLSFSTGYFLYDFLDIVYNRKIGLMWEVIVHHIAVASMFWYNMHYYIAISFSCIALLSEVNSVFLHARKLFQMLGMSFEHWIYKVTAIFNIVTFAIFRGAALVMIDSAILVWYNRVTFSYYICLSLSMLTISVINPILFWRLLKNDFLRTFSKHGRKDKVKTALGNGFQNNNVKSNHVHYS